MKIKSFEVNKKGVAIYGKVKYDNPTTPKAIFVVTTFVDDVDLHSYEYENYTDADDKYNEIVYAN